MAALSEMANVKVESTGNLSLIHDHTEAGDSFDLSQKTQKKASHRSLAKESIGRVPGFLEGRSCNQLRKAIAGKRGLGEGEPSEKT